VNRKCEIASFLPKRGVCPAYVCQAMALPCVQVVTTAIGSEGMHMEDYVAAEVSRCGGGNTRSCVITNDNSLPLNFVRALIAEHPPGTT